jgi:hypothetical protein
VFVHSQVSHNFQLFYYRLDPSDYDPVIAEAALKTGRPDNRDLNQDASKHFLFTAVSTPEIGTHPASWVVATTIKR